MYRLSSLCGDGSYFDGIVLLIINVYATDTYAVGVVHLLWLGIMWCMEHESSDAETDSDDTEDEVNDENNDLSVDHSEPDWRQFAATYRGFQLDTTQELLTSNLFSAIKAEKEYVSSVIHIVVTQDKNMKPVIMLRTILSVSSLFCSC